MSVLYALLAGGAVGATCSLVLPLDTLGVAACAVVGGVAGMFIHDAVTQGTRAAVKYLARPRFFLWFSIAIGIGVPSIAWETLERIEPAFASPFIGYTLSLCIVILGQVTVYIAAMLVHHEDWFTHMWTPQLDKMTRTIAARCGLNLNDRFAYDDARCSGADIATARKWWRLLAWQAVEYTAAVTFTLSTIGEVLVRTAYDSLCFVAHHATRLLAYMPL